MAFDRQIAALTIFCEASSASQDERECVAHVIINRVADGRWGKTAAAVCLKRMQFSEWNGDAADNANLERGANTPDDDPVMMLCGQAWVMARNLPDKTGGATHYFDHSIPPPNWSVGATLTLRTDKFSFYKDVK